MGICIDRQQHTALLDGNNKTMSMIISLCSITVLSDPDPLFLVHPICFEKQAGGRGFRVVMSVVSVKELKCIYQIILLVY